MAEIFVDSNVFLRFFAEDDTSQSPPAEELFRSAARKEIELVTGPPVFFEVAWTLKAAAKWPSQKILETLSAMTATPNMKLIDKEIVIDAISLAKNTGQNFADAYIAVSARARGADVATFNKKHFSKLGVPLFPLD